MKYGIYYAKYLKTIKKKDLPSVINSVTHDHKYHVLLYPRDFLCEHCQKMHRKSFFCTYTHKSHKRIANDTDVEVLLH